MPVEERAFFCGIEIGAEVEEVFDAGIGVVVVAGSMFFDEGFEVGAALAV